MKNRFLVLFILAFFATYGQGFLHREGQNIKDSNGNVTVLRGLGLGGWMVQEGYMLKTGGFAGSQHTYKQKVVDLIGVDNTKEFYNAYLNNGITKKDIDSLASWGFNSIRLPMHYDLYTLPIEQEKVASQNTWIDKGFKMTDDLLDWCSANKIYLILDLHAAPGGQGIDSNISDFDPAKPSLWSSVDNQNKTVALWKKLAERYKDNPWIGAFDIINEPNWDFTGTNPRSGGCDEKLNGPLRDLQIRITNAIREVDKNHLIFIEGNCWGNNYNGMFPIWDDNLGLSFHKYSNKNDIASIQTMLDFRTQYNVPIWCGESGENSNEWFKDAITLLESNNIGWSLWPMKKIDDIVGICKVNITPEYNTILNYWKNGGAKPNVDFSKKALMQIAENFKIENTSIRYDVIDSFFRQVNTKETKAHKKNTLPGILYATEYDLGHNGIAYFDKVAVKYDWVTKYNEGGLFRNDGVDIIACNDILTNGYNVTSIDDGEWLQYSVEVGTQSDFDIDFRLSSDSDGGILLVKTSDDRVVCRLQIPNTGGKDKWKTFTLKNIIFNKGKNKIKVYFEKGNFNLNYFEFKKSKI